MVKAIINGIEVNVPAGTTILDAAKKAEVNIPSLCKHPDLTAGAGCGICVVKVKGVAKMLRACCTNIGEGMDITTHDPELVKVRKNIVELILSNHPKDCLICPRNNDCELQRISSEFGIRQSRYPYIVSNKENKKDCSTQTICIDGSKCILCGRCIDVCQNKQNVYALSWQGRGVDTTLSAAGEIELNQSPCVKCGQCSNHCPVGAIVEQDETQQVWDALADKDKFTVVQIAPAVRVAVGEGFGYPVGTNLTGEIVTALKKIGFDAVFDTNMGADLTIIEEASEFVKKFTTKKEALPLITSCCPAWVDYLEKFHGDMIEHFSSCKSPHEMVGVLAKTYYAKKHNIDPSKIYMVSIMPCTAKKYEIHRSQDMSSSGYQDVDVSLTTRELVRMIKQSGIDFKALKPSEGDSVLADYTGAGTIFGVTGGVMEAALRTAYHYVTGKELSTDKLDFKAVRGFKGIKEAAIDIEGTTVKVAVAHGLANVDSLLKHIKQLKAEGKPMPYDFVEVMACDGGCIGGGGQPYGVTDELRKQRAKGLYKDDKEHKLRCSHLNPAVQQVYKEFLGEPLGENAHKYLHNHYQKRKSYQK